MSTAPEPTDAIITADVSTMQSELQRLGPPPLFFHHRAIRAHRDDLLRDVLKDNILSTKATKDAPLRTAIAEEVKAGVEGLLTMEEKNPRHTLMAIRSRSRSYWIRVHQEVHHSRRIEAIVGSQPPQQLYSLRDIERTLFFWAEHQHIMSYGEVAYELCLPLNMLLSWIMRYVELI